MDRSYALGRATSASPPPDPREPKDPKIVRPRPPSPGSYTGWEYAA